MKQNLLPTALALIAFVGIRGTGSAQMTTPSSVVTGTTSNMAIGTGTVLAGTKIYLKNGADAVWECLELNETNAGTSNDVYGINCKATLNATTAYPLGRKSFALRSELSYNSTSSTELSEAYGLYGVVLGAQNPTNAYGCYGWAQKGTTKYGLYGSATGVGTTNYGVYATATGATTNWAFWGVGNGFASGGTWQSSDARLKKEIDPLTGSLASLLKLAPKTYRFDLKLYPNFNLPDGKQFGVIAQDLEKVLPELVMDTHQPDIYDKDGKISSLGFDLKAVNYTGLIPILIGGIQEQQAIINDQATRISKLEADMAEMKSMFTGQSSITVPAEATKARLEQNAPNPFNENTVIRFYVPATAKKASIQVNGTDGKAWKSFDGLAIGQGQLVIAAGSMSAGNYTYTLVVDGVSTDTKTMMITR